MRKLLIVLLVATASMAMLAQKVAGLKWTAPAGWTAEQGERPMRAASYDVPAAAGDKSGGECVVYFFGAGQGGSVEANIERWKSQIKAADGNPANAKIAKKTIHGLGVTTIDSSGTYTGMGGPMAAGAPQPGYRLLGAVIENPGGNIFVKFAAPAKTVAANQAKFEQFIGSFQPE